MATTTPEQNVETKPRQSGTKNDARRIRKSGLVPAVLYGAGLEPLNITVDPKQMRRILNSESGHNTIFDLAAGGDSGKAMIVDWQFEPIKGALLHVDLKRIAMDKLLRVSVPVTLKGEAHGVKVQGGILEQMVREVEIECLPADIPANIAVDISNLALYDTLRVSDLPHSDAIKFLNAEDATVAHVVSIREEAPTAAEAEVAAAAAAAATAAEPEVAKKGKPEEAAKAADAKKPAAKK